MIGIILCIVAFAITHMQTRRSLGRGMVALMAVGYAYGLARARLSDIGAHFLFDASLFGLYVAAFSSGIGEDARTRDQTARIWTMALVAWPCVCILYSPLLPDAQPLVIQLVGLRDAVLMLPCLMIGARLRRQDLDELAPGLGVLNLIALGFALLEYVFGIEAFIPRKAVTDLVYMSNDIVGSGGFFYRIPSTFPSAHAYGGTMLMSIPFVAHGLESGRRVRVLCLAGLGAAVVGVFLCGARLPVVELALATVYTLGTLRMRGSTIIAFALTAGGVAYVVATFDRFQRFMTLGDTDMVRERVSGSVNMSFFDVLANYPVGTGLARSFGTNIPYFLMDTPGIHGGIGLENEYGHILLDQGIVGLALWTVFILYATLRWRTVPEASPTASAYIRGLVALGWLTAFIGAGMLSSIPSTPIFLAAMGMTLARPVTARAARALRHVGQRSSASRARQTTATVLAVPRTSR